MKKVKTNASEETSVEFKDYTGIIRYRVMAINPTLAELNELGINFIKEEPEYIKTEEVEGKKKKTILVTIWCKDLDHPNTGLKSLTYFIKEEVWFSKTGKTQFINALGKTNWAETIEAAKESQYFVDSDVCESHMGLEAFCQFLWAWMNVPNNVEFLESKDFEKWLKGDFKDLKKEVKDRPNYIVKLLTGMKKSVKVDDNGQNVIRYYSQLFNKYVGKHNSTAVSFRNFINKDTQYNNFGSADYPVKYTFGIEEFIQPENEEAATTTSKGSEEDTSEGFGGF